MNQDQIWSQVQEELRFQLAKRTYDMWLKNTSVVSADGSTFRIGVPSKLAKDWLEDRFSGLIQETLQAVTGAEVGIDFVISPSSHRPPLAATDGEDGDTQPPRLWPKRQVTATTRCSSTEEWAWARLTLCTPSATRCTTASRASASST